MNGCWLLMLLLDRSPQCQEAARDHGGIPVLVGLLRDEVVALGEPRAKPPNEGSTRCTYIAGCLAKLAERCPANQQALLQAGGIEVLLEALEVWVPFLEAATNVCTALAHAVHWFAPAQRVAGSGAAGILAVLATHPGEVVVRTSACRAVAALTEHSMERVEDNRRACAENREAFLVAELDAVALLLRAVTSEDATLTMAACWALANLAHDTPQAVDRVREMGGLAATLATLDRLPEDERVCEYACRLLADLTRGTSQAAERSRGALRALGGREAVSAAAQRHAASQGFALVRARDVLQYLRGAPIGGLAGA